MNVSNPKTLLINCIYLAHEGEGVRVGAPQIFVRVQGCAIGCINCDSKETWDFTSEHTLKSAMSVPEVMRQILQLSLGKNSVNPLKVVSITGGDPLDPRHVPGVLALIEELKQHDFFINIEASGVKVVPEIFDLVDFISFDFKTPSTKVKTAPVQLKKLVELYPQKYQIKSVVADEKDFAASYEAYLNLAEQVKQQPNWVLTPCFEPGEVFSRERFEKIMRWNYEYGGPFKIIGQQHKWIYGPDVKQV